MKYVPLDLALRCTAPARPDFAENELRIKAVEGAVVPRGALEIARRRLAASIADADEMIERGYLLFQSPDLGQAKSALAAIDAALKAA